MVVRINYYNQHEKSNKKPASALAGIKRMRRYFVFSTAGSYYLIGLLCWYTQILEMVIFMDISAVSEPILIKQR